MKKIMPIILVGLLVLSGLGAAATFSDQNTEVKTVQEIISVSTPKIMQKGDFVSVSISEQDTLLRRTGNPMLPVIVKAFTFPFKTKINSINVEFSAPQIVDCNGLVQPAPELVFDNAVEKSQKTIVNEDVYFSESLYPVDNYNADIKVGLEGNEHKLFVIVRCSPVQYSPVHNQLLYSDEVEIEVEYILPENPVVFADEYDLVVIAPEDFSDELAPLIDHKNSKGMDAYQKTLEEIYSEFDGRDEAEQVKYFIKDALETQGVEYVLLVGGMVGQNFEWYCPIRYTNNHAGSPYEEGFLSDLYYEDIYKYVDNDTVFEDWDENQNDIFAEYSMFAKDVMDALPDINVGRIACRSEEQVTVMVEKIITYESTAADPSWFNRMLCIAGDTYPEHYPGYEGELATNMSASYMQDFDIVKLWASDESLTGQSDVEQEINEGAGFIHMAGHANPSILVTHPPQNKSIKINILRMYGFPIMDFFYSLGRGDIKEAIARLMHPRLPRLNNGEKQPIVVIGGCHNSQYNTSLKNIQKYSFAHAYGYGIHVPNCFSWYLASVENSGAIATMGNTGLGMGVGGYDYVNYLDGYLMPRFFYHYGVMGEQYLGVPHSLAITDYVIMFDINSDDADRQMIEQWAMLGDPSLMIGGYSS